MISPCVTCVTWPAPAALLSTLRTLRTAFLLVALFAICFACASRADATTAHPGAATLRPATPSGLPMAIEPMADYVEQTACDPRVGVGTRKLADYLSSTYAVSTKTTWSSVYACGTDGTRSEHYDGRAVDWMVDVTNARQKAAANSVIAWLLATDAQGNRFAMARRLGVMYLIWDNRMWGAWSGRWEDYNGCAKLTARAYANSCHRTHIHISLGWAGARGITSFWTKKVAATDYGPCRPADLNWAPRYSRPNPSGCAAVAMVQPAKGASATKRALVTWSGAWLGPTSGGPAVTAVQRALHLTPSGTYDTATVRAVRGLQSRHQLATTGSMTQNTWRALLAMVS